jgi:hypothetical protein
MRVIEHHWHIHLYHPDKYALAEHSINPGHCISLAKKSKPMDHIREVIEIELHPNNMSRAWKPLSYPEGT